MSAYFWSHFKTLSPLQIQKYQKMISNNEEFFMHEFHILKPNGFILGYSRVTYSWESETMSRESENMLKSCGSACLINEN